jgi:hypothetical protein
MWLTLGLKALGIGKTLLAWGRSALGWIFKDWRHLLIAVLGLFAAYWYLDAAKANKHADKAVAALERANKTIADMTAASEAAKRFALAEKVRIEADNERKANEARETQKRLAADYDARLASWLRKNNRGATSIANLPKASEAASGIVGAGPEALIPDGYALVEIAELQKVPRCYSTLEALQGWARSVQGD